MVATASLASFDFARIRAMRSRALALRRFAIAVIVSVVVGVGWRTFVSNRDSFLYGKRVAGGVCPAWKPTARCRLAVSHDLASSSSR